MTSEDLYNNVYMKAKEFGLDEKNSKDDRRTIINPSGNAIIRNNLGTNSFNEGKAYFGLIDSDQNTSEAYSDFSYVIFPDDKDNIKTCVVALGIGSGGFSKDFQLASHPGLRRLFLKLRSLGENTFFKTSFDDNNTSSSDLFNEIKTNYPSLKSVIDIYKTVLPASQIVSFDDEEKALNILYTWLASYAKMRSWGTAAQKKTIESQLDTLTQPEIPDEESDIIRLLEQRKYIVLQGAPGTGKTYSALKIASKYDQFFFEQFHAETNYSDFVYGIEPVLGPEAKPGQFKVKEGILYKAIKYAQDHLSQKVLLIIDEINRANLSNVLGPVFYLFEYQSGDRKVKIQLGNLELEKLPDNLHVIATMNTADRSLAVVDFALRRRFAWYTLRPHEISVDGGKIFMKKIYNKFADIFFEFATDDELNLQPGQSYFIVKKDNKDKEMKERMIYELMPLIKEYLAEGYLLRAKDSFCDLFLKETGKLMYE